MINTALFRGTMVSRGYTQRRLADELNMAENTLSRKIRGLIPFDLDEVCAICNAFHIEDPVLKCQIFLP